MTDDKTIKVIQEPEEKEVVDEDSDSILERTMSWEELAQHDYDILVKYGINFNETKFKNWFMERKNIGYHFDALMKARLFSIHQYLRKDKDHFMVISGKERLGKSSISIKIAAWLQPDWTLNNLCVTFSEIVAAVKRCRNTPYQVIVIDEGGIALFSKDAMKQANKFLTQLFMIIGAANLVLIVNVPNFHFLDTYVRDHRTDTLIQVLPGGRYKAVVENGIRRISRLGFKFKQINEIPLAGGTFWNGRFSKQFPKTINRDDYVTKKGKFIDFIIDKLDKEAKDLDQYIEKRVSIAEGIAKKEASLPNDPIARLEQTFEESRFAIQSEPYGDPDEYDSENNSQLTRGSNPNKPPKVKIWK